MSLLAKASTGKQVKPQINVIMGVPKIGKTTFAAAFPSPFFLDLENRSFHVNVTRLTQSDVSTLDGVKALINELMTGSHQFQTFVIDSAESLEDLIHIYLCQREGVASIEQACGGFAKGYIEASEIGRDIMKLLQELRDKRGMTINIVAHTATKNFSDPATNAQFTRYEMRVHHKLGSVIRDLADNQLFVTHKYQTFTDKTTKKQKAVGEGDRVIYTEWRPAFDAGNTLGLPFELPLSYEAFKEACENAAPKTADDLKKEIPELLKALDGEMREKAFARFQACTTAEELQALKDKILTAVKR